MIYKNLQICLEVTETKAWFVRDIYYSKLGAVSWVQCSPSQVNVVNVGHSPDLIITKINSNYQSASVIPICNQIDFGNDWLRVDQDLQFTDKRQFCTKRSINQQNIIDKGN